MEVFDEIVRQFLLTLWNVYAFFVTYAGADGFDPDAAQVPLAAERPVMDRWILSQLHHTVDEARRRLEAYDATGAGRRIESFVDDLSNWYVRRSRRRFWNQGGEVGDDARAAFHTLHECLVTVATLLAPFTPFVAEELWRNLAAGGGGRPDSVHLADYPVADHSVVDHALDDAMADARRIVELGRRVRVETRTRTRQPLRAAVAHLPGAHDAIEQLLPIVADELNVREVRFAESASTFGRWRAKPSFKKLGPRLGPRVKAVATALAADDGAVAAALAGGEVVTIDVDGGAVTLAPDDVDLTQEVLSGWGVAGEGGVTVALDLELDDDLRSEGRARELIRLVQDARKAAGLDVGDRIVLGVATPAGWADAFEAYRDAIASETLAVEASAGELGDETFRHEATVDDATVVITLRRV
jgi:isoleucyl-tRNA synthetase